jgi:hypothetical protein
MSTITVDELKAIPAPERTTSWNPVPHYEVLEQVNKVLENLGITILKTRIDTVNKGAQVFAAHTLDINKEGKTFQIGWRNSIDKTLALGFTAGTTIVVCSNMVFNGQWIEFKKHTNQLEADTIYQMASKGIETGVNKSQEFGTWMDGLVGIQTQPKDAEFLFVEMLRRTIVPKTKALDLINAYDKERDRYGENLYSVYNAATQTFRDAQMYQISERSPRLNTLMDDFQNEVVYK